MVILTFEKCLHEEGDDFRMKTFEPPLGIYDFGRLRTIIVENMFSFTKWTNSIRILFGLLEISLKNRNSVVLPISRTYFQYKKRLQQTILFFIKNVLLFSG